MTATLLYEGKAKRVFETDKNDEVIISFKDDATAFNGLKKDSFTDKGRVNLAFTKYFFNLLESGGIKTHIISFIDEISLKAKKVSIVPLEVVVRNLAAGSLCKRLGFEKGMVMEPPLCEYYLKNDALNDPILCKEHIKYMNTVNEQELACIEEQALKINEILRAHMDSKNITLVDFKLEFGKTSTGEIILADEISPDTCRFWKKGTMESLDKDVYREGKGDLVDSYKVLADILGIKL
ncbi:MAG: phosphoribosylaminoimidazolesuccinocarboxamide synthase [Candidatus Melainabacteria bacterium GWF2_37_15]|nr:MAG: phosphoribosylaminoimidazolesuccinocarboxamide synthase [Candidatus Melainabacteria bacterium GWF2_37_15]